MEDSREEEYAIDVGALASATLEAAYTLSDEEISDVVAKVYQFCLMSTGVTLYPYQEEFACRIIESLIREDGDEITALFSRQSGKTETVATVTVGCCVILPKLCEVPHLAADSRIAKFKNGLWVGIFAPSKELGSIMHDRMKARMRSREMREMLADPGINLTLPKKGNILNLSNGSHVDCTSAAPQSKIEGRTYHLILCEETQDIDNLKLRKSIHPMGAATAATMVKIGTPSLHRNDFYDACDRGKRSALLQPNKSPTHFEYDYRTAAKYNPKYAKYVAKEIERLGYESDEFRMAYRLHWLLERGHFITPERFDECAITTRDHLRKSHKGRTLTFIRPDYPTTHDRTNDYVAAIDIGKNQDPTVVTVGKVWWDNPIDFAGHEHHHIHVVNWLEIQGDNHDSQHGQILDFLANYRLTLLIVDSTGKGEPIYDRFAAEIPFDHRFQYKDGGREVEVVPFVFSMQSKHNGYQLLSGELQNHRITYVAGKGAKRQAKYKNFVKQMYDLQKSWRGRHMVVEAPDDRKGRHKDRKHDDYPDSLMMLCWGVNRRGFSDTEQTHSNPFFNDNARIASKIDRYFGQGKPRRSRRSRSASGRGRRRR